MIRRNYFVCLLFHVCIQNWVLGCFFFRLFLFYFKTFDFLKPKWQFVIILTLVNCLKSSQEVSKKNFFFFSYLILFCLSFSVMVSRPIVVYFLNVLNSEKSIMVWFLCVTVVSFLLLKRYFSTLLCWPYHLHTACRAIRCGSVRWWVLLFLPICMEICFCSRLSKHCSLCAVIPITAVLLAFLISRTLFLNVRMQWLK